MIKNFPYIINKDGIAIYYGPIISDELLHTFYDDLLNKISWEQEQIVMFGKNITTKRKVAFYADKNMEYTYANKTKKGLPWNNVLIALKKIIETYTNTTYNACLLNLYHNGNEGMGWHSDDEKEIIPNSSIASFSVGAERKFSFKHKLSKETVSVILENGSLLEMVEKIQENWWHSLPKSKKITSPRINLTFRQMIAI
jgi:alkylated DNA repair dioxygenase AlkB